MALVSVLKDFRFKETKDTEVPLSLGVGLTATPRNGIYLEILSN